MLCVLTLTNCGVLVGKTITCRLGLKSGDDASSCLGISWNLGRPTKFDHCYTLTIMMPFRFQIIKTKC